MFSETAPFVGLCLCVLYALPELTLAMAYVTCVGVVLSVPMRAIVHSGKTPRT